MEFLKAKNKKKKKLLKKQKLKKKKIIKQKQKNILIDAIAKGTLPIKMDNSSDILLKKGEIVNLVLKNVNFLEPRAVRYTKGGGSGASIRVAKGVTIKTGGGKSKSESVDEIKKIDIGTLTITNKRIIFSGNIKTISIDLNKLVNLTPYKDGIATRRSNKQKTEYFTKTNETILNINIQEKGYTIPADGLVLQAIIKNNINKL